MLSEYQIGCPSCRDPKALNDRERGFRNTRIKCSKCGLDKKGLLPAADEKLQRHWFGMAQSRLNRRATSTSGLKDVREFWWTWPEGVLVILGIHAIWIRDDKLLIILSGVFLMMGMLREVKRQVNRSIATTHKLSMETMATIHNQLTSTLRLMQYSHIMDPDLDEVMEGSPSPADVVHDYEVASGLDNEDAKLDNPNYAFVRWLAAELRSIGCDQAIINQETLELRDAIYHATKINRDRISNP
jgi:hypothetical protein